MRSLKLGSRLSGAVCGGMGASSSVAGGGSGRPQRRSSPGSPARPSVLFSAASMILPNSSLRIRSGSSPEKVTRTSSLGITTARPVAGNSSRCASPSGPARWSSSSCCPSRRSHRAARSVPSCVPDACRPPSARPGGVRRRAGRRAGRARDLGDDEDLAHGPLGETLRGDLADLGAEVPVAARLLCARGGAVNALGGGRAGVLRAATHG